MCARAESALKNPGIQLESDRAGDTERREAYEKEEEAGLGDSYEIHPSYWLTASVSSFQPQHQVKLHIFFFPSSFLFHPHSRESGSLGGFPDPAKDRESLIPESTLSIQDFRGGRKS